MAIRLVWIGLALVAIAVLALMRLAPDRAGDRASPLLVDDRASLISAEHRERVTDFHEALREAHDIDYRVLAVGGADDIAGLAHRHFGDAGVGNLSASGRGLLLVIDAARERVRLEVSTSLEGVYTDAFVSYVQNRQMAPFFGAGRVADGIVATSELIVGRAQEAESGSEFSPPMPAASAGGGATAEAAIGTVQERLPADIAAPEIDAVGLDPRQVVDVYLDSMANRDARPDLPIYTSETVRMLRDWVLTPAQMDNLAKIYRTCAVDRVQTKGDLAVVRYSVAQRRCAPYFLRREGSNWKLDLAAASSAIRFNHENEWRLTVESRTFDHGFAFEDWSFDRNGFPAEPH